MRVTSFFVCSFKVPRSVKLFSKDVTPLLHLISLLLNSNKDFIFLSSRYSIKDQIADVHPHGIFGFVPLWNRDFSQKSHSK